MSYNRMGNYDEDGQDYDPPIWMDYYKEFHHRQEALLKLEMYEFEREHPNLTLSHGDNWIKEVKVCRGPVLFRDDGKEYREIVYTFNIYYYSGYYEPSELLHKWLSKINEMTEWMVWRKNRQVKEMRKKTEADYIDCPEDDEVHEPIKINKVRKGKAWVDTRWFGQELKRWTWICVECGREWKYQSYAKRCEHQDTMLFYSHDEVAHCITEELMDPGFTGPKYYGKFKGGI